MQMKACYHLEGSLVYKQSEIAQKASKEIIESLKLENASKIIKSNF